jgi:hypothetical protein
MIRLCLSLYRCGRLEGRTGGGRCSKKRLAMPEAHQNISLRYLRYQVISPEHASHKRYHHVKYDSAFVPLRNDVDSGSESVQKKVGADPPAHRTYSTVAFPVLTNRWSSYRARPRAVKANAPTKTSKNSTPSRDCSKFSCSFYARQATSVTSA